MRVKKNSVKSLAKWVVFFIAIAMSAVFLSSCNASQSSSSNNNERTENTKDPTDNQNENTDDSSTPTDQGDIEIYAGPGSDYYYEGKIHYKDVRGIVLEDHEWLEVKYNNNQHGYIQRDMLENEDLSDVPLLVDTIPVTVGGRKYLETADFQYRLSGDIDLFEDTDALNKLTMVEKGNVISKVYDFQNENNNKIQKYIIIGKESMFNNIKNNKISQFFMDCTYKCVNQSSPRFKLMVLTGFDPEEKKRNYVLLF